MKANIVSIVMMIFIFVVAYFLDCFIGWAESIAEETWNFQLLQWVKISSYLIFAGTIVTIEYLIIKQKRRNRIVSYIFLVFGLLILFIASPLFISIFQHFPSVGQMVTQASVFVAAIGFIYLLSQSQE